MKIAVWHNLPSGGGRRALYHHVRGLVDRGHQVECWCPPTADRSYLPMGKDVPEHVVPLRYESTGQDDAKKGALASVIHLRRRLAAMDEHCRTCAQEMLRGGFDLLFANSCSFFGASAIGKHAVIPSILYLQEPYRILYEALPVLPWSAAEETGRWALREAKQSLSDLIRVEGLRIQARDERTHASCFDRILVNSHFSRESVLRAFGLDAEVCYLGIDQDRFYPTDEPKTGFVVSLGSLSYGKGVDRAITAIAAIPAVKRPHFIWVANSVNEAYRSEMQQLAGRHGVGLTIKVQISDTEIRSILSRAALLLYTPRLEPFGYAPLEANACGTPVVAIAEGGVRETVQDGQNGLLVSHASPELLARAMERLIDDQDLSERLGRRGLAAVHERWNLGDAVDRLELKMSALLDNELGEDKRERLVSQPRSGAIVSRPIPALREDRFEESRSLEPMPKTAGVRAIAFYLPQYYPIPENDTWWGAGFTEWSNVVTPRPLFDGHYQPHLPGDLGFYDLRVPETRAAQAAMAREHGIYGFCYYHYWFGGRRLLDRPISDVLTSGEPEFPFCICWANENWTRVWDGQDKDVLQLQTYSERDDVEHIRALLPMFADRRYIKVEGRPLFVVYRLSELPDPAATIGRWRDEVERAGFPGLYLANVESNFVSEHGLATRVPLDAAVEFAPDVQCLGNPIRQFQRKGRSLKKVPLEPWASNGFFDYDELRDNMLAKPTPAYTRFPCVTPMWDNTPRRRRGVTALVNSTPESYEAWLRGAIERFVPPTAEENFVFLNAWNEWGEGNHLEPCLRWGKAYLNATERVLRRFTPLGTFPSRNSRPVCSPLEVAATTAIS